jgi:hypothetical protein
MLARLRGVNLRRHQENPVRQQDDANMAAREATFSCGICQHGGGTLVSTRKDIPAPEFPYRHAHPRFCVQYHFPRRVFAPFARHIKQANSRVKQRFNAIGRTEVAPRRTAPRPQKAG